MATDYISKYRLMMMGSPGFLKNVAGLLRMVAETRQGHSMLTYFGEHAPSVTSYDSKPIALAIKEQEKLPAPEPIKTSTFGSWRESGPSFQGDTQQPLIRMPDFNTKRNVLVSGAMMVTDEGMLIGHVDFPKGTSMDAVLFHELCHAYLYQIGLGTPLQRSDRPDNELRMAYVQGGGRPTNIAENVEEQIVCGLLAGRGLACCENAYRVERGLPARVSYAAPSVAIKEDRALVEGLSGKSFSEAWTAFANDLYRTSGKAGPIAHVLDQNGFTTLAKAMAGTPEAAVYGHGIDPRALFASMVRGSPAFTPKDD